MDTMESPDKDLMAILVNNATILETEVPALTSWWTNGRQGGESLAAFLLREGILGDGVSRMLDLARKGYLQIDNATSLVHDEGRLRLREALRQTTQTQTSSIARVPPIPSTSHTSTSKVTPRPAPILETTSPEPGANIPQIGERLGKCLLTDEIGRGGCGIVYRALHVSLKIPVAVKLLLADADAEVIDGFRAEASTLARLNHPNVVRVLDFDDGVLPYLVLEYIEGPSLRELIQQSGRIRVDRAVAIILQVASGLAASSALGIVHRDVTPANILLTRDSTAKLTDYGLAALMADLNASSDLEGRGTASYMSPEQARGDALDARSDIYALGACFYHAVTGSAPFSGGSRMQVLLRHAMEPPTPPRSIIAELDSAVSDLILKMMAKSPEERFPNFEAVIAALAALAPGPRSWTDSAEGTTSGGETVGSGRKKGWLGRIAGFGRDRGGLSN
jgi:hypothetical protein